MNSIFRLGSHTQDISLYTHTQVFEKPKKSEMQNKVLLDEIY